MGLALQKQASIYKTNAKKRFDNARFLLQADGFFKDNNSSINSIVDVLPPMYTLPYTNSIFHFYALFHSIIHLIKFLFNFIRLLEMLSFGFITYFEKADKASLIVEEAFQFQLLTCCLDFANVILSFVSLLSRTLVTIFDPPLEISIGNKIFHSTQQLGWGLFSDVAASVANYAVKTVMEKIEKEINKCIFDFT